MNTPTYGTVYLMGEQWLQHGGILYRGFTGQIELHKDEEVLGFSTNARATADWFVTVRGETQALHIMGCQVRAVLEHGPEVEIAGEILKVP